MAVERPQTQGSGDRVTPNEIEVEKAVLGAMLIDNDSISRVVETLGDETAFYNSIHRKVYKAILTLFDRGDPADQVTVSEELAREGALESVGGAATIAALASEMATAVNAEFHAKIVLEAALRRRLIDSATQTVEESYQKTEDIREVIDRAEQRIFSIAERDLGKGVVSLSSVLDETFEAIERAHENRDALTGVTSGYDDLDEITGGFQRSDLVILAARPAMGKTSLVFQYCSSRWRWRPISWRSVCLWLKPESTFTSCVRGTSGKKTGSGSGRGRENFSRPRSTSMTRQVSRSWRCGPRHDERKRSMTSG